MTHNPSPLIISKIKAGKPFHYRRGKVGVLLIHGFTGTPYIFRDIGKKLADLGYTVSAPLLAGHGTTPNDLENTTWEDWCGSVESAYKKLALDCPEIFVIGASFGSNLACLLAAKYKFKGLILIGIPRWIHKHSLAVIFTKVFKLLKIRYFNKPILKDADDGELLGGPNLSYFLIPIKSVGDFFYVVTELTGKMLSRVRTPTLIIQSTNDGLVRPKSATFIFEHLKTSKKQLIWINYPHHEIHTGDSREEIYGYITDFMVRLSK